MFLSGNAFLAAALPMQLIMPTVILIGLSNVTGIQILVPMDGEKYVLYSEIAGAIVDVIINAVLIPKMSSGGAAIGTTIAEITVLAVQLYFMRKYYPEYMRLLREIHFRNILLAAFVGVLVSVWCTRLTFSAFYVLVISAVCYAIGYFGCLLIMKDSLVYEALAEFRCRVKNAKSRRHYPIL